MNTLTQLQSALSNKTSKKINEARKAFDDKQTNSVKAARKALSNYYYHIEYLSDKQVQTIIEEAKKDLSINVRELSSRLFWSQVISCGEIDEIANYDGNEFQQVEWLVEDFNRYKTSNRKVSVKGWLTGTAS